MRFQMQNLSTTGNEITDESIHGDELSEEGFGTATPRRIYKSFIRFTFVRNGLPDPTNKWPSNWLRSSVQALAEILLA